MGEAGEGGQVAVKTGKARPVTRTAFIKLTGAAVVGGLIPLACNTSTPSSPDTSSQASKPPTQTPDALARRNQTRYAKLTEVVGQNKDYIFTPERGFVQEDFDRVRKATYMVVTVDKSGKVGTYTAWAADMDIGPNGKKRMCLVTTNHTVPDPNQTQSLFLKRPGVDQRTYNADLSPLFSTGNLGGTDHAVFRFTASDGDLEESARVEPIKYRDGDNFVAAGEPLLEVGFPEQPNVGADLNAITNGSVLPPPEAQFFMKDDWSARIDDNDVGGVGMSGAPVCVKREGEIIAVGVHAATDIKNEGGKDVYFSGGPRLSIAPAIAALKKQ